MKDRVPGFLPEIGGLNLLPEIKSMYSCLRDIKVHNGDGANDHSADTGTYDIHGATLRAAVLKADWVGIGWGFDRAYLADGHDGYKNNR